ncbi:uncharacterized protein BROUX77_004926 [Berkeleyomyces rouxiae]|uniref:uncharacterized protein n=1 Tax=Berkeleyomyces rouxiae TaxID=2035830 RepID=UPI003B7FB856
MHRLRAGRAACLAAPTPPPPCLQARCPALQSQQLRAASTSQPRRRDGLAAATAVPPVAPPQHWGSKPPPVVHNSAPSKLRPAQPKVPPRTWQSGRPKHTKKKPTQRPLPFSTAPPPRQQQQWLVPPSWPYMTIHTPPISSAPPSQQLVWAIDFVRQTESHNKRSLTERFASAEKNLLPLDQSVRQHPVVYQHMSVLLSLIQQAKLQEPTDRTLPSLTSLYQMQAAFGHRGDVNVLFKIALKQAEPLVGLVLESARYPLLDTTLPNDLRDAVLDDQEAFWKLVLAKPAPVGVPDATGFTELPEVTPSRIAVLQQDGVGLQKALEMLLPWQNPTSIPALSEALMSWYIIFSLYAHTLKSASTRFAAVKGFLDTLMAGLRVGEAEISQLLVNHPDLLQGMHDLARISPKTDNNAISLVNLISSFHKQLSDALRSREADRAKHLFREFPQACALNKPSVTVEERQEQAMMLNFFVYVFCCLKSGPSVDLVLNTMARFKFDVDSKTYTSMVNGWRESREPPKIEALWRMLKKNGAPVDDIFWAARISALGHLGMVRESVNALFEMDAMHQEQPSTCCPPTIGAVNATLTSLFRRRDAAGARRILTWAGERKIEPDVVTYNILLEGLMRCDLEAEAPTLLERMRETGIEPDIATYTILIEHALSQATAGATPEEQVAAVLDSLAAFEQSDMAVQTATYAKMLHVVLAKGGPNGSRAAQAVLAHMAARDVAPSAHVFTILVEHYFTRGDTAAVHALVQQWDLTARRPGAMLDCVFWECVISGFVAHGAYALALHYLDVYRSLWPSVRMALTAQADVLAMLVRMNRLAEATALVQCEMDYAAKNETSAEERYWSHRFWQIAREELGTVAGM